jgi:hypothetical protein
MKSLDDFRVFYDTQLIDELSPIENLRKEFAKNFYINLIVFIGGGALCILLFILFFPVGIAAITGLIVLLVIRIKKTLALRKSILASFKENVIQQIIHFIDDNLQFNHARCIPQSTFSASKIYTNSGRRYSGDDWVGGKLGQTDIEFSEIHVEDYTKDKDGKKSYYTIFRGIFFIADFHKDFIGETFVLTDSAEKMFGRLGKMFQKMNISRPQLVKMENVTFEKQFVVYGSDQIEARYIITPVLMETMLAIQSLFKGVQFSFIHSKIYITIPQRTNMFEPNFFKPLTDFNYLSGYYTLLFHCINLVETLELNNRIWSKE